MTVEPTWPAPTTITRIMREPSASGTLDSRGARL
jgi:hypothetical protein